MTYNMELVDLQTGLKPIDLELVKDLFAEIEHVETLLELAEKEAQEYYERLDRCQSWADDIAVYIERAKDYIEDNEKLDKDELLSFLDDIEQANCGIWEAKDG